MKNYKIWLLSFCLYNGLFAVINTFEESYSVINNINSQFTSSNINELKEGVNVKHPSFGSGEIMKIDIDANQKKAIVKFKSVGEKTLLLNFAKLKIIK